MDGKLCPRIHPPPIEIFMPLFQGKPPFLKFWLESQIPPLERGGVLSTMSMSNFLEYFTYVRQK